MCVCVCVCVCEVFEDVLMMVVNFMNALKIFEVSDCDDDCYVVELSSKHGSSHDGDVMLLSVLNKDTRIFIRQ